MRPTTVLQRKQLTRTRAVAVLAVSGLLDCSHADDQQLDEVVHENATTAVDSIVPTQRSIGPRSGPTIGATDARFSVSADGQATYSIPIWTPDGVLGAQPALQLSYSSASTSANRPLGVGWALTGFPLSRIARCPTTRAIDGENGPVSFTGTAYCLDGQRLM